jgi:hypothetical protein
MEIVSLKIKTFSASGFVYGYFWGGGEGAYPMRHITANSLDELLTKANNGISDGSLDSGMGFESLAGAMMLIKEETKTFIEGKPYINTEYSVEFIGELNDEQLDFLNEIDFDI